MLDFRKVRTEAYLKVFCVTISALWTAPLPEYWETLRFKAPVPRAILEGTEVLGIGVEPTVSELMPIPKELIWKVRLGNIFNLT